MPVPANQPNYKYTLARRMNSEDVLKVHPEIVRETDKEII